MICVLSRMKICTVWTDININPLTVRSQLDDQSLECHLKYAMFTQKCHQNHQIMEYFENTILFFRHVKSHPNSLLNI